MLLELMCCQHKGLRWWHCMGSWISWSAGWFGPAWPKL